VEGKGNRGWGIFSNFVGGKVLTKEDLKEPLEQMHQFLLAKNVASEVSVHLCESVETNLIGQKTGNWQSTWTLYTLKLTEGIKNSVRKAIDDSLTRILTPTKPTDLLHEISAVRKREKRPYTISFVGVNGVGKSTNLSKIAFKLLNNGNSVLIAACDTFRSGAVEQLRKHVVNLTQWVERNSKDKGLKIELFERGYGKDAADVAAHAVRFADAEGFGVVLIDTAGRRHNDQALMGSLGKVTPTILWNHLTLVCKASETGQDSDGGGSPCGNRLCISSAIFYQCSDNGQSWVGWIYHL
jgi:signal recognition particle receptor subunit alpha